ncbi:MAG: hypothetical protein ACE5JH_11180 [Acidobacteriota bacterium]
MSSPPRRSPPTSRRRAGPGEDEAAPGTSSRRGGGRLVLFVLLAAVASGSLLLYTLSHRRPPIPADRDHFGIHDARRCLDCHGPGGKDARGPNHPLNDQCFQCHERR